MKIKTINKLLTKKFEDFLSSITDDKTREAIKNNSIITGGSIASMLLREKINDYDIYFTNKSTALLAAKYFVNKYNKVNDRNIEVIDGEEYQQYVADHVKQGIPENEVVYKGVMGLNLTADRIKIAVKGLERENGIDPNSDSDIDDATNDIVNQLSSDSKEKYRVVALSCNAISLSDDIQLVIRFYGYGSPEMVHETYDFIHATNYWTSHDKKLHINQDALESLITKELKYFGSKYPIASVIRTKKFLNRGWTCNAGQYLKMCFQISELDLNDMAVLEDQLTGVDVAYFNLLINAIKSKKESDPDFNTGYEYISKIIDSIF